MWMVFEKKPNNQNMKQISVGLGSEEDAISFIETMKLGVNYKSLHPDYDLFYSFINGGECEQKQPQHN